MRKYFIHPNGNTHGVLPEVRFGVRCRAPEVWKQPRPYNPYRNMRGFPIKVGFFVEVQSSFSSEGEMRPRISEVCAHTPTMTCVGLQCYFLWGTKNKSSRGFKSARCSCTLACLYRLATIQGTARPSVRLARCIARDENSTLCSEQENSAVRDFTETKTLLEANHLRVKTIYKTAPGVITSL